ncbi:hypothetical protein [Flavobacterium sp.]|uniref:hypothetical protein n=1 Tax=Flavobacterium sp. TaxID=239 RepID=UPI003D6B4DCC
MNRIKVEFVVILFLSIYAISSFFSIQYISLPFAIGIAGLLISVFLVYRFYKYSFYFLSLLLIFAIPNLVTFSQTKFYAGIGSFGINIIPTLLLFYLCVKRRKVIAELFTDHDEIEKVESRNRKILMFKNEFKSYSQDEIRRKLQNDDLVDEAKSALNELLD